MSGLEILKSSKDKIIKRWRKGLIDTYPEETRRFLITQKDPFQNPVRQIIFEELERLFMELIDGFDREVIKRSLDNIIAIRAVQDFSPSESLSFIFMLKDIIIEFTGGIHSINHILKRIDEIALMGFDIYMNRKETIYRLRANEMANQVSGLLRKKGLLMELPQWKSPQ